MSELRANCDQALIEDYFAQELRKANEILPSWDGGFVKIWEFDQKLFELTLSVENETKVGKLMIYCATPIFYSGPFEWHNSILRLFKVDDGVEIRDSKLGFLLKACVIDVIVCNDEKVP